MRPRVGHGWTSVRLGKGRYQKIVFSDRSRWMLPSDAMGWPRCARCRRPYEVATFGLPFCCSCFFYKGGLANIKEFWRLVNERHPLAGYVIGDAMMRSINCGFTQRLEKNPGDFRFLLREQPCWTEQHWEGRLPEFGPLVKEASPGPCSPVKDHENEEGSRWTSLKMTKL